MKEEKKKFLRIRPEDRTTLSFLFLLSSRSTSLDGILWSSIHTMICALGLNHPDFSRLRCQGPPLVLRRLKSIFAVDPKEWLSGRCLSHYQNNGSIKAANPMKECDSWIDSESPGAS